MKGIFLGLGKGENKYRVYSVQLGRFILEPPKKLRGVGAMNFAFTLLLGLREAFNKKALKVVELSTRGGGGNPISKKNWGKRYFFVILSTMA